MPLSSSYTITSQTILKGKIHEPSTIEFILKNSFGGDVIHAGAGFGDFLPALSILKDISIWSFEPNTENFQCAKKTIEINNLGNIKLMNFALGEYTSINQLKIKEYGKSLGPRSHIIENSGGLKDNDNEIINIKSLDSVIPQTTKVALIHLDAEGYEKAIIKGAQSIIQKDQPLIILEIDSEPLKYNAFMEEFDYFPIKHLIHDSGPMVFINTVYKKRNS